jgi:hypothetical protein
MALASIANIGGGILGDELSKGDRSSAEDQIKGIQALYNQIKLPDIEQQKLNLEQLNQGQMLTPEQQQVRQMSMNDQLQDINLDPRLKQTQMNALDTLQQIAGKGFTPDELNAMQEARMQREADTTAKLKQIQQQQDMRGLGNSEMSMAQQMLASQSDANRGASDARDMQAQAFKRSLDAIMQSGNLAGGMESAEYGRQADLANALRGREQTNLQNQVNIEGSNVDRFNRALEANTNRLNAVSDQNVGLRNNQQTYNKELLDKQFQNQMQLTGAKAGTNQAMANMYGDKANATANKWAGIGSGIGSGMLAMGGKTAAPAAAKPNEMVSAVQAQANTAPLVMGSYDPYKKRIMS